MQQSLQPPKTRCREGIVEKCCILSLLTQGLAVSLVFGTVSSLHPSMIFILVSLIFPSHKHDPDIVGLCEQYTCGYAWGCMCMRIDLPAGT